ncbi:hypothetical protein [Lysinibacillus piscis]|uniref:Aspartate/glutamate racemase family protein n=1 Tax=Lysinibacillus piscis TaxID=2518931 RepID=A0ABQ5NN31_9BACI|nr:hypothetical protein [Lysinibacillus sp. KH24]GLC89523.1 hypothetical protein LYSBPC_26500 [Lysinibacillus sp. KH24]
MKKLGCLHAHYSNIDYIAQAFRNDARWELVHFVEPGLMQQVAKGVAGLEIKVKEQVEWMVKCGVDAILITCTNYIALLNEEQWPIPIIKIDEPYFKEICQVTEPQTIVFTNPATVEGTMKRLRDYAQQYEKYLDIEVRVIEDAFPLIMQGKKECYHKVVKQALSEMEDGHRILSVAQLSMVNAAQEFQQQTGITIHHQLRSLLSFIDEATS